MAAWRYEISVLVLKNIFQGLEEKLRISARSCNILYIFSLTRTDTFYREARFIGPIKSIKMKRNKGVIFSGWKLLKVCTKLYQAKTNVCVTMETEGKMHRFSSKLIID